ncbi:hypothetical protein Micbo1qcDRAFT_39224 [Microdochium bolleyi]|uniref:Uncharacterized protein n=1 Tax=Microdochium bolleyi TaxID=196109 RepID=A0A136J9G4_9PEZI|nr:hypothetical protein Micbo1qcDRAFT_39224 [Microdochium bolleyi]
MRTLKVGGSSPPSIITFAPCRSLTVPFLSHICLGGPPFLSKPPCRPFCCYHLQFSFVFPCRAHPLDTDHFTSPPLHYLAYFSSDF